jgi:hypothetical protein
MNLLAKIFYALTGGRPMTREAYFMVDRVSGESVYFWRDAFGRKWMATNGASLFRVRTIE